jgi:acetyltransferase-like isoleucine patch superfamily enzyme
MSSGYLADSADVDERAVIGAGTSVWHLAQIREHAVLGQGCIVGRGAYVGAGVRIGRHVKIQNYALVYEPAVLEDGVFVGPAAVLTNDQYPRSVDPSGQLKRGEDWEAVGVTLREGASLGARSVCVAPVTVGRWALVAAGAVVVRDVPDFALMAGVPARRIGWVGRAGVRLQDKGDGRWVCPSTGTGYVESAGILREDEDGAGLPRDASAARPRDDESETT